jgi:hypothetical protein
MNVKRFLIWLGLLALIIGVGLRFWPSSWPSLPVKDQALNITQTQTADQAFHAPSPVLSSTSVKRQLPGGPYEPSDPRWAEWLRRNQSDHNADWKTPFNLYGKVVDQDNVPVQAAKVHFTWNNYSFTGTAEADTQTDASGLFSLQDKQGKLLVVSITKDGYYSAESNRANQVAFDFANFGDAHYHDPESKEIVLFRIRKKGNAEPLYYLEQRYIPPSNSPQIDVSLQRESDPDFKVAFTWGNRDSYGNFDWTVTIQGMNGTGFIESTNPQDFIAPNGGYRGQVNLGMHASEPNWRSQIQKQYFVRLGNGHYARIDGEFGLSNSRVPSFVLTWVLNPSGSRNLEFDPNKQINQ